MQEPTFRAYCKELWKYHPREAKHWARDQIIWPVVAMIFISIISALAVHRIIDWQLFWTSLFFYLIILIAYALFHFIKSGWRMYQSQETKVARLNRDVEAKTEECIAARGDALKEMRKHCDTEKELVAALEDLAKARKEAADNSDAFHLEYAKNTELRRELDRFKSNRAKEEWLKLEHEFAEYGGGSNVDIEAFWSRHKDSGKVSWSLMRGWDEPSRKRFWFVMNEAGQVLLASEYAQSNFSDLMTEDDPAVRWLTVLCAELGEPMTITGRGFTEEMGETESGAIADLPRKCALCCAAFASQEKWPLPSSADLCPKSEE